MSHQFQFTPRRGSVSSHYESPKGEPERRLRRERTFSDLVGIALVLAVLAAFGLFIYQQAVIWMVDHPT